MFDKLREECGIFGIWNSDNAARLTYLGLYALQHRGQESAGIVSADGQKLYVEKEMGHVSEVFKERHIERLKGRHAIGHVRYSTAGEVSLREAQPLVITCHRGQLAVCHNGNFPFATEERSLLESAGAIFSSTSDTEVVLHLIARSRASSLIAAIVDALSRLEGAYSMLFMTKDSLIAVRDPRGFRPLSLGKLDGSYVIASETCAFDLIGAEYLRDIQPGEVLVIDNSGISSSLPFLPQPSAMCVFEHVYFARPDSIIFERSVNKSRHKMGRRLALEQPVEADIVVPVPDSGVAAAIGYSRESGIALRFGLVRNHYIGRTFIEPKQSIRDFGVRIKLNPVRDLLEGRRVVLIDDSIVRGTTSQKIVSMVRQAGAKEVHMRISCPPTIAPCYFGVDTPTREELIAANHSVEEIRDFIGADSLGYLSLEGLLEACGATGKRQYCTGCYTGIYPLEINRKKMSRTAVTADQA
ncbi:MAG: amidophosphoribosyltransferase [Acidobacteriota bacterium]|nr:amidophosphoribosyltransferase [Blastocatellia bacterium]MDW8411526.1 amidophosphoribosyltransferase [Acidobacteriota bacterium]